MNTFFVPFQYFVIHLFDLKNFFFETASKGRKTAPALTVRIQILSTSASLSENLPELDKESGMSVTETKQRGFRRLKMSEAD